MSTDTESIVHDGRTFIRAAEGHRGKKAAQVAGILEQLMDNPGVPMEFEAMCEKAGAKYPQDVQAAVMALEMCELCDLYYATSDVAGRKKAYYVWTTEDPEVPES